MIDIKTFLAIKSKEHINNRFENNYGNEIYNIPTLIL